tara:strand:+ start:361 stop:564 length:204 start_codon:yes stop_codon:yes gene_type:complete
MTRAEKIQELKELRDYLRTTKSTRCLSDMYRRVEWLEKNLDTPQSEEEKRMAKEYRANKNSKTLFYN